MVAVGRKGHIALLDLHTTKPIKDMQVRETVRDVVFLHNELFFDAAQMKYMYMYNQSRAKLHCLKVGRMTKEFGLLKQEPHVCVGYTGLFSVSAADFSNLEENSQVEYLRSGVGQEILPVEPSIQLRS
ncbi:probable U3 small nucleolar RNA-associated protein 7 [Tanacetum coccineum]